ncbi:heme oxygenase [Salicibibacter cibarius]|uniref:Heme oxygenase n=1 Tax=Salicibibacter cibarius TaxID=2743000 RepID=A0A7T7CB65_9BACI|nr:heme oxygenase [Salicibibacter cibarius]QQK75558.1 heme oxygenase [Salicibibacter cibarius]
MIIVQNQTFVTKGYGERLVERFRKTGKVEYAEGFIGLEVLTNIRSQDHDEIVISTRWDNIEAFHRWTESQAFKDAHAREGGRPDYIIENKVLFYRVDVVRESIELTY